MGLINQDIKNFVMGISQQPPTLRNPEQLQEQINGFSSEANGLQKRPPTMLIKTLHQYTRGNKPLAHFINRDKQEKYVVIFDGEEISVYDLAGNSYPVSYANQESKDYITTNNPRATLKCLTIADYTFVTNTTIKTRMSTKKTDNVWASQGALINVKSGQYGRTYRIEINGTSIASYTTPDGSNQSHVTSITTDNIASQLASGARNNGWTVITGPSWLYVYGKEINKVECYDGYNNQAMFGTWKSTQKFTNLPSSAPDGFVCLVGGEQGSKSDDYYVKYNTNKNIWEECAKPDIECAFDNSTMPHTLVRKSDGSFVFRTADWSERDIGDDDSNPLPSFVGFTVNEIFYFKNRLGFLAGENVILTRSADFFNFWMTSAMNVQDTDPIDLAVSDNTISTLYHAVSFDAELIVFSENAQFSLVSEGVLSPKTAVLTPPVTHFGCSLKATPVNAGRNIYFVAERSEYSTVREFYIADDNTAAKDAQDITAHVPSYIPNGVYKIITSNSENIMMYLTEGEENAMYVYKYLFIEGRRQQASWSKWILPNDIYGGAFVNGYLYIIMDSNGYLSLEKISFTFNTKDLENEPYRVMLDSKKSYIISDKDEFDEENETTIIDLYNVYGPAVNERIYGCVVCDNGKYYETPDRFLMFQEDMRGKEIIIGMPYEFKMELSTIFVKQPTETGIEALLEGRLQLRNIWFNYDNSGFFKVDVIVNNMSTYTYKNTQYILGTQKAIMGEVPFSTRKFDVPLRTWNNNCRIILSSKEPQPVAIIGAGWIGNYNRRTKKY